MENQHRHIKGYRELNESEIAAMNEIKQKGVELGELIEKLKANKDHDLSRACGARNMTDLNGGPLQDRL